MSIRLPKGPHTHDALLNEDHGIGEEITHARRNCFNISCEPMMNYWLPPLVLLQEPTISHVAALDGRGHECPASPPVTLRFTKLIPY